MKALSKSFLLSLLCLSICVEQADAANRRVRRVGGGPPGGVILQTPNPTNALEFNNRGVELGQKGLWRDAIGHHTQALLMDPGNKQFRINLSGAQLRYGNELFKRGQTYEAMKQFRGALYVDPDNLPADEGLDACFVKLHKDPLDFAYRNRMAEEFDSKAQYEDAIVEYRKCVKMRDDGLTHANLGRVLLKAGKPVDGFSELRIAVAKTWGNTRDQQIELAATHRQLGDILKEFAYKAKERGAGTIGMKRLANAGVEYRRAVTINPADAQAVQGFVEVVREATSIKPAFDNYLMLGGAYLLAGDFAHAKIAYEQCYKLDSRRTELGQARIAFHQAVARSPLASEELVAESVSKVNKFLSDDPDSARWWYILGRLKEAQHDNNGAMEAYRRAEKINYLIDPDLKMAISRLGGQSQAPSFATASTGGGAPTGGRPTNGTPVAAPPAQPDKPPPDLKNQETYTKAESLLTSNPDGALTMLGDFLDKNPTSGHAYLLKAKALEKLRNYDDAAAAYRQAALFKEGEADDALRRVNTIRVQDDVKRAREFQSQGDFVKAADALGDAIVKAPNLPLLHRQLAEVMDKMGDRKSADKERAKADELDKSGK